MIKKLINFRHVRPGASVYWFTCAVVVSLTLQAGSGSANAVEGCGNEALRIRAHSSQLPDCRAYELVSPAAKYGWYVKMVTADNSRAIMLSFGGFVGNNERTLINSYATERTESGWSTAPTNEPPGFINPGSGEGNLLAESGNLDSGLFKYSTTPSSTPDERNLYVRSLHSDHSDEVGPPLEVGPMLSRTILASTQAPERPDRLVSRASASSNLNSILFSIEGPSSIFDDLDYLWPGDTTAQNNGPGLFSLYEYTGTMKSEPKLVGVRNGKALRNNSEAELISQCGASLGFPREGKFIFAEAAESYNAISEDGSRVFFTAGRCPEVGMGTGPQVNELYARTAGTTTTAISEPSKIDCSACEAGGPLAEGIFQGASKDGSKVFFLSTQPLLEGAEGNNLYEYNFDATEGNRVKLIASDVEGVSRVAGDGSRVYFVAQSELSKAVNPMGNLAQTGADNLYVYNTDTSRTAFVGSLCSGPRVSGTIVDLKCPTTLSSGPPENGGLNDLQDWQIKDERPVDVNDCFPEDGCEPGRFLVFTSYAELTSSNAGGMAQVFEYDANAQTLVRVAVGRSLFGDKASNYHPASIVYPVYAESQNPAPQLTSVSSDGSYVAFQSSAALTPQAENGVPNVYEYHLGEVSLISDGQDRTSGIQGAPSVSLVGMDNSGASIYFTSADAIVPEDGDTQVDIYDARIGGGFSGITPSSTCEGEGCQGELTLAPFAPSVGSIDQEAGEQILEPHSSAGVPVKGKSNKAKSGKKRKRKAVTGRSHRRHLARSVHGKKGRK